MSGIERVTIAEFHGRLKAQGVSARRHVALVCPMCNTVQSMASMLAAAPGLSEADAERRIGFSCIGRITNAGPPPRDKAKDGGKGCNWTLGGLLRLHEFEVIDEDGDIRPYFRPATPEEAQALEAQS